MAFQIGNEPERISRLEKFAPWIRRVLIIGCLVWAACSLQNYSEDTVSHTIKGTYPLLMGYEKITSLAPGFDPAKARWKAVDTAAPVYDGQVLLIRTSGVVYAVKISHQTARPEKADYAYLKVGDPAPPVVAATKSYPNGLALPGCTIAWGGHVNGQGFIYLDEAFIWGKPARFEVGVPFQTGEVESYRKAVPSAVHFESVPWKIPPPEPDDIIPLR